MEFCIEHIKQTSVSGRVLQKFSFSHWILWPSYLYNGNIYAGKTASSNWNTPRAQLAEASSPGKPRDIMMPTLSSLVAGCWCSHWWQNWHFEDSQFSVHGLNYARTEPLKLIQYVGFFFYYFPKLPIFCLQIPHYWSHHLSYHHHCRMLMGKGQTSMPSGQEKQNLTLAVAWYPMIDSQWYEKFLWAMGP